MHMVRITLAGMAALAIGAASSESRAQSVEETAVKARNAHMELYAYNLGILGGMARGNVEYNADRARRAADDLVALTRLDQSGYWIPGTDSLAFEGSRLKPGFFDDPSDTAAKGEALADAATEMQAAAGTGVDGVRGAMTALGGACSSCHRSYREPEN